MDAIPTITASHLLPFAETLKQMGAPLHQLLQQAKLPSQIVDEPDAVIAEPALWSLIDHAAQREGIKDFGMLCMQSNAAFEIIQEFRSMLSNSVTLNEALLSFCRLIPQQNSHAAFWLQPLETETWFWRLGLKHLNMTSWQTEQYTLAIMTELVRISAGKDWQPAKVHLQAESAADLNTIPMLVGAKTWIGQQYTGIAIANELLSQPFLPITTSVHSNSNTSLGSGLLNCPPADFICSLRQILKPYLSDERPDINMIAEATGSSKRTLQRRLTKAGMSYSTVLQQACFEKSEVLLRQNNLNITDVAYEVGYSCPAHFARAFKRVAGVSPRQYRKHVLNSAA